MSLTPVLLASLVLSLAFSYAAIPLLTKFAILDVPMARSNHKHPVPRGGGIAIMLTVIIMLCLYSFIYGGVRVMPLVISVILVGIVSFVDDVRGVSIIVRSICHLTAAFLLLKSFPLEINFFLLIFLTFGLYVFANFYNFMDGIDGSATVGAIHIGFSTFAISLLDKSSSLPSDIPLISIIIIGASSAFLIFNWQPARMFLGDVGSITLGFICGWLMVNLFLYGYRGAAVIIPLYYMADSGLTLLMRLSRGKKIWTAHSEHFFQKAVRNGQSHAQVTGKIIVVNCILSALSILSIYHSVPSVIAAVATVVTLLYNLQTSATIPKAFQRARH
jgi:UDP-N-acetylmuramyl pentapeptide phosphotransferase/UDP-N-acetylglucosamine-1-phosphate transferase